KEGQSSVGSLGSRSDPKPVSSDAPGGAPNRSAPARCVPASAAPSSSAPSSLSPPGSTHSSASQPSSTSSTAGVRTKPGSASQRSPAASAAYSPGIVCERVFTNASRPSARVTRYASLMSPPPIRRTSRAPAGSGGPAGG